MTDTRPPSGNEASIPPCQLLIVTGKGGVGKTAVATALAAQSARNGKKTLLTIYEREDVVHPLLGTKVSYELRKSRPNLWVSRLDSRLSMKEYIHRTVPLHLLYDWIIDGKVLTQFTDAAPGFDELMCLGKLYDLCEGSDGKAHFDTIIFDAPATGHCALMLRTPKVTAETVRTGPLFQNAMRVHNILADHERTCVLVVALAEEMAIQEGLELQEYVRETLQFNTGPMIVNRLRQPRFSAGEIEQLQQADTSNEEVRVIIEEAAAHHALTSLQRGYLDNLRTKSPRVLETPQVIQPTFQTGNLINAMAASLRPALSEGK